ncbi:MAG: baseplate J/gp47 family protein [Eubacterium sp.]|nr:baseplate J/gp47 family protein [Eubacterium sp.]
MKITYDEILKNMQNVFFEKCGQTADVYSDIGVRFQAVASELFNLACYSDFVIKQTFVQTASGKYLDKHAQMRNMQRKTAAKAHGSLTFYISEASENEITVPAGTICSVEGSEYLQFRTTQSAAVPPGELSVTVPAEALENGSAYNVKAGTVTAILNPPGYITQVENAYDFTGGWDDESDEALRKRIMASYSVPPTGLSRKSIAECVMKLDDVLDCNIVKRAANTLDVYVKTKDGTISETLESQINNALLVAYITVANTNITLATRREYSLNITVSPIEGDSQEVVEKIKQVIKDYTDGIRIGESVNLAEIYYLVSYNAPVKDCIVTSDEAINGVINGRDDSYWIPSEIAVECYV